MSLSGISKQENRPHDTSHTVVGMKPGAEHLFTYNSFTELQLASDNRAFNYMGLYRETFIYFRGFGTKNSIKDLTHANHTRYHGATS